MEQIMSTGGGWQDQVGGITPGLKYITSMPGIDQQLKVTHVDIPEFAKRELDDRFVLIYTGQRRLAVTFFVMSSDVTLEMNQTVFLLWKKSRKQQL